MGKLPQVIRHHRRADGLTVHADAPHGRACGGPVYDLGLDDKTIAGGLVVARASNLVYELVGCHFAGAYNVSDPELLTWLTAAHREEGWRLEPVAVAGFPGAMRCAWDAPAVARLTDTLNLASHVVWTTGGGLMPGDEFAELLAHLPGEPLAPTSPCPNRGST